MVVRMYNYLYSGPMSGKHKGNMSDAIIPALKNWIPSEFRREVLVLHSLFIYDDAPPEKPNARAQYILTRLSYFGRLRYVPPRSSLLTHLGVVGVRKTLSERGVKYVLLWYRAGDGNRGKLASVVERETK